MGKLIQVPYIKQPNNSAKCGAACAAMIIKHYTGINADVDEIWTKVAAISPESQREYCATFKIGAYISINYFGCSIIRYACLKELLEFCNANGIAPIINHKSFESKKTRHFSVIKNISKNDVIVNDPENNKRVVVSLSTLEVMATKSDGNDEVGGNTAIIPFLDKFPHKARRCPRCGQNIDISFSCAVNTTKQIVDQDLCLSCDSFSPTIC